jgi:hypothetical protein
MSGTATAPAYMMNRCCKPKMNSRGADRTSSTGWTRGSGLCLGSGTGTVWGTLVSHMVGSRELSAVTTRLRSQVSV